MLRIEVQAIREWDSDYERVALDDDSATEYGVYWRHKTHPMSMFIKSFDTLAEAAAFREWIKWVG